MAKYNASPWQIYTAWLAAKGNMLSTDIPLSRAIGMLRESGDWDLIEAMRGPVMEELFRAEGSAGVLQVLFAKNRNLKDKYDTGQWGSLTTEQLHKKVQPHITVNVTKKDWDELLARIIRLEKKTGIT